MFNKKNENNTNEKKKGGKFGKFVKIAGVLIVVYALFQIPISDINSAGRPSTDPDDYTTGEDYKVVNTDPSDDVTMNGQTDDEIVAEEESSNDFVMESPTEEGGTFDPAASDVLGAEGVSIEDDGYDATNCYITLTNNTGQDIRTANVLVIFYDKDGFPLPIYSNMGQDMNYYIPLSINNISAGESAVLDFNERQASFSEVYKMAMIVSDYTTFDDTTLSNQYYNLFTSNSDQKFDTIINNSNCLFVDFTDEKEGV